MLTCYDNNLHSHEHAQLCGIARSIHWSMASIFFFQSIKPCVVQSHYPSQSVSLTAHSHLSGLMVTTCLHGQCEMVANSLTLWFQSLEKAPTSLYIWLHNIIWIHIIWILVMWIHVMGNSYLSYEFFIYFLTICFRNCLSNVWRAFESHRESQVLVLTERFEDGTRVLTFVVKLKCIVLHTIVKFSENLYPEHLCKMSAIVGNRYCLRLMTLFSQLESLFQQTLLSSLLKVFKWIQGTGWGIKCTGLAFGSMSMCKH